jgi:hypothetical protein
MASHRRGRGSLLYLPGEERLVRQAFRDWNSDPDILLADDGCLTIYICERLFEVWGKLTPLDLYVFDANGPVLHVEAPPLAPKVTWIKRLFEPLGEFAVMMK